MKIEPQKEHEWLQQLVGEWTYESEAVCEPGKPAEKFKGSESVRSLGGLWVLCEGRGEMPGGGVANTIMTLGYDPQKKHYVGTWIGSMMTCLWVYNGSLDAEQKILTLDSEGPSFTPDATLTQYRDAIEIKSPGHRILTSQALGTDGQWNLFMTAHYRRKK